MYWVGKLLEIRTFLDLIKEGKAKLVTANYDDTVEKAIRLMQEKEYSQLPVLKEEKLVFS